MSTTPGVDIQSPTWRGLKRHILERIAELQGFLEAPSDPEATATIRGQIKELRALMESVEPKIIDNTEITLSGASLY